MALVVYPPRRSRLYSSLEVSMTQRARVTLALAVILLAWSAGIVEAQESMALRFYITPKIETGATPEDGFRPKYFDGIDKSAM